VLHDPDAHEPLLAAPWDEGRVRDAIRAIAADAEGALDPDRLWLAHPLDYDEEPLPERGLLTFYLGAAGVVWALLDLERRGAVELRRDWEPVASGLLERYLAEPDFPEGGVVPSLWMGTAGLLLLGGDGDTLLEQVRANATNETRELMWGAPGTMLAAQFMLERTGEERWAEAWRESAELLWAQWEDDGLWTQQLYGRTRRFLGPAHGFAGNVLVLHRGRDLIPEARRGELERRATAAADRFAVREDGLCNWPPLPDAPLDRVQWCHGAPGMVASLAGVVPDELLLPAGELTWRAGPLRKGAGLCHGTAGNGYAFLKLFVRSGDELWLDRARSFALHAIAQVELERERVGRGRYTLWTGDVGTAVYLLDCLEAAAAVPTLDRF
jgi:Lanthionine synthetase C-like protein